MAKTSFTNLKLKVNSETTSFTFNNSNIEVLQYLPIEDKYDLIMITLQKAHEGAVYNPLKLEMYFNLNLVYLYTNISFTEKQKENEGKLYDTLVSSGLLDEIISHLNEDEYNDLIKMMEKCVTSYTHKERSIAAKLADFIEELPEKMSEAAKIAENFNPEQFKNVIDFATAANGGRPIQMSTES